MLECLERGGESWPHAPMRDLNIQGNWVSSGSEGPLYEGEHDAVVEVLHAPKKFRPGLRVSLPEGALCT